MNTINPAIRNIISNTVSTSYTSTFILDTQSIGLVSKYGNNEEELRRDSLFQKMSNQEQEWILTTMGTDVSVVNTVVDMPSKILGTIWEFVSDIVFPGKRLAKTKENIANYINTAKNEYNKYVLKHEQYIDNVQTQIDTINKRKPIMKDYILKKVALKLCKLGINSQLEDYPMESIDMRVFTLNKEFNFINNEFYLIKNDQYTKILENMPIIPVFPVYLLTPILVKQKIKELENKFSDIQNKTNLVFEKMKSDNSKIENLSIALNNIAKVYTNVNEKFIPAIEQILDIISVTYKNDVNRIPENLLFLLRTSTTLLKELAERRIIPQNISKVQIDSVIEASNDISVSYEKLRKEFMNAA